MSTTTIARPPEEAEEPEPARIIRAVGVHGLKSVKPRRSSISITPWELRVADGESTDGRRRSRRVRERLASAPQPGDDGLLEDLSRLRERAFALGLDLGQLERAATS